MDLLSICLIAVGLAMDCFAVSVSQGICVNQWNPKILLMALLFGLFQGGMPLIGYYAGSLFASFFSRFAPWIALALLVYIGGKMIWESFHKQEEEICHRSPWDIKHLLVLAVATSIDALATGVIFIPVPQSLWLGISIIALVSFLFALLGYGIGVQVGKRFTLNVEMIGGIILIIIGLKIFIEGICF